MAPPRYFAIVPAAGNSVRMGRPKLLLPLQGQPLIARTIAAWRQSRVDRVLIVVRPDDRLLADVARQADAEVILPSVPPPDMKASIQAALRHLMQQGAPAEHDAFLVAPADLPGLSMLIINRLIECYESTNVAQILVPELHGKRGHPVLFPGPLVGEVFALANDEGLNALVERHLPRRIPCDDLVPADEDPFADVDTPADLARLSQSRATPRR